MVKIKIHRMLSNLFVPGLVFSSRRTFLRLSGVIAGMFLLCLSVGTDVTWAQDESGALTLQKMTVLGSRRQVAHTSAQTLAPVDKISGDVLTNQASGDISNAIRTAVPSYNVSTQPISDAATFVRPVNMRGLAPDQVLVFVNGKRRHRGAVISFLGNGVSNAAQGPDISAIPAIAIKRIEVLRDSASAQYGSDAIAGVINFVIKDSPEGGLVETQWGQTYEGDGAEYRFASNLGIPLSENGFFNLSAEYRDTEPTSRSVQRTDAQALIDGGNMDVRQPHAQIWGAPDIDDDLKLFVNSGFEVGDRSEVYAYANYARRDVEGGFYARLPGVRTGVFVHPDDGNVLKYVLPADFDPASIGGACQGVDFKPGDTFEWTDCFPGGFTPQFGGTVKDLGASIGLRGSYESSLAYDVSYTVGRSRGDFRIRETINSSLGPESPKQFELGSYIQTEHTGNVDLSYQFKNSTFASPIFAATGAEVRREGFEVLPGEEASWRRGALSDADAFGIGANGFSGFSPGISGEWTRNNIAFYVDLETDITSAFTIGTMGRVENFQDYGSTTDGKVSAMFWLTPSFGVRGSTSTGFRVPTPGQENIHNTTTAFIDGKLAQLGTIPASCPEAKTVGSEDLTPEESLTFSGGVMLEAGPLSVTADYFNIRVDDRIGQSKEFNLDRSRVQDPCLEADDILTFTYFGNGFDTRTQGFDIVWTVDVNELLSTDRGQTELVFVGNYTKTEVVSYNPDFLDEKRILQLEEALPQYRFNATLLHAYNNLKGFVRLNYFGSYTETHTDSLDFLIDAGEEFTLDLEASYTIADRVELSIGAQNILNNFPTLNPHRYDVAGAKYPESSPMGSAGGFFYGRLRYFL